MLYSWIIWIIIYLNVLISILLCMSTLKVISRKIPIIRGQGVYEFRTVNLDLTELCGWRLVIKIRSFGRISVSFRFAS